MQPFMNWPSYIGVVVAAVAMSTGLLRAQAVSAEPDLSGRQLFVAACANCHGANGRGAPQSQVGFTIALPDFSDCNYSSRENAQDWFAIVHEGGRIRSFSKRMPAFGSALSSDQIERVVAYVRSLCEDPSWPRGELNLPRAHLTEKAFPEDESVFTSASSGEPGARASTFAYIHEKRFGARTQIEVRVPLTLGRLASDSTSNNFSGHLGDVSVALKRVLSHNQSLSRAHILSGGVELALPTGNASLGTGSGTPVAEPFVLAAQMLGPDAFVQFQGAVEFPFDARKATTEAVGRAVIGRSFAPSGNGRTFTPMVEVEGVHELSSGAMFEWSWVPQMQISLSRRQHISASVGARLPFGRRAGVARELLAYLVWDWFDGGFLDGW
ncbi:MAG: cytochrome c [Gemmatimonadaceae bacterium]